MGTVPLAFAGAFLGLLIGNFTVSIVAMIGLIMLMGVVVNNGIVLVDCMNQLREEGIPKKEAIVKATVMRIRPVLMTAVTTILGLLPLALGMGMGAEIIQPVAVVCIGGLTYATLTTLLIIPILYDIMRREKKPAASEAPSIPEPEKAD
jgi:multidrug efflux pump subunit AcrB